MKKIIDKKYVRYIVILTCILISIGTIISFLQTDNKVISPEKGVIDLQDWNNSSSVLSLKGQWDFYWKRFMTYKEVMADNTKPDLTVNVPKVWNNYKIDGKKLPGFGYGTYVLKVVNAPMGKPLALKMPVFLTAYDLYIDDRLVSSSGKVGRNKEQFSPGCKPQEVEFTPEEQSFEIIVHVANFTYAQGGMYYAVKLGTPEQMQSIDKTIADIDLFLFGALIIMAFYYMCIFLRRREDKSSLYVVLMCALLASITSISGDFLIYRLIPFISYEAIIAIDYIVMCWSFVCTTFIIGELFPEENSKKILKAAFVYAVVMTLLILLTPISFYSRFVHIVVAAAILICAYCIFNLALAFIRGKKDSLILLLGALADIVCVAHETLFQSNASKLGSLILLFIQTFVLAKRYSEAYINVSELSQKLLKLDKVKDEFLANTSHELRTPLSGILGITEAMLKGSDGELSNGQRRNLTIIAASSRRLSNLVNDILDYSKMKNGDLNLYIQPLRIDGLIHTIINIFKQLSMSKEYDVITDLPEVLPPVSGDENRVAQILYNLIGNAVKFTSKGYVKISARKRGNILEICISDTGEGIPADKLEDIFKSFEQVDNSLTRRHGGTGLGLSITKHLVELQGGSIWVESHLGQGSQFYFTLPLSVGELEGHKIDKQEYVLTALDAEEIPANLETIEGDIRILLVDDDAVNLQAASALLKLEGYGVTAVTSGLAALELLKKHTNYSLVILDVMMPEMSGYELCKKLREDALNFELPVLMLTARNSIKDMVLGFEAGANDYLPKPFEPEELVARVRTLTDLKISVDRAIAAEVAFMQAQIKPHFLFNTLNTISSFCDTNPELAQQLIDNFAGYLRETFNFKIIEMYQPVERELNLVSYYIEIEKFRFGDELKVIFDVDTSIKVSIPTLSIQPLVENAICHGLRKKGGEGTITIRVKKVEEGVLVAVEDDGLGIQKDKLETLLTNETGGGIGLWNIDRRLKKLQGKGITIESTLGLGTKVSYTITTEVI